MLEEADVQAIFGPGALREDIVQCARQLGAKAQQAKLLGLTDEAVGEA